jgi:PBP1b-binding outer membrane lipoprotein LpoB
VVLAILLFLTGCSLNPFSSQPEPEIKVVTKVEKTTVPKVARPKPIQLTDTRIYVVNKDNLEDFIKEFTDTNGDLAFIALSVKDYENLALNIGELRRYINQQTEIIVYYEEAVSPPAQQEQNNNQ